MALTCRFAIDVLMNLNFGDTENVLSLRDGKLRMEMMEKMMEMTR